MDQGEQAQLPSNICRAGEIKPPEKAYSHKVQSIPALANALTDKKVCNRLAVFSCCLFIQQQRALFLQMCIR